MPQDSDFKTLDSSLKVYEEFPPPNEFRKKAWIKNKNIYGKVKRDPEKFWAESSKELSWFEPWQKVLIWEPPDSHWFVKGKINAAYNCVDRHAKSWRKNKVAIYWEGESGERRTLTYSDLSLEVNKLANALKNLGLKLGDRATLYLPMIPELPIAMLACARIGVIHNVVFSGFSPKALLDRIRDSESKVLLTSNYAYRRGKKILLKQNVDNALEQKSSIEKVVIFRRNEDFTPMIDGRDFWWDDLLKRSSSSCEPEILDSEAPLFILYTSGTTGKPKGVVHVNGGYLVGSTITQKYVFDLKDEDIYWCTADIGWITGHSYIVYGPLALGATEVIYEGAPDFPQPDRVWKIIERYGVTILYTAPTLIRAFMKWGKKWPRKHNLTTLRLLGSVGEPINPEVWLWYRNIVGNGKCQVIDTYWQTENGMIIIAPLPGITTLKPGSSTFAFPGLDVDVVDSEGNPLPPDQGGYLIIRKPWPAMLKTLYKDHNRYRNTYWNSIPGVYFTGDGARKDRDGYFWIMGRIDDVINVSGHRLGTMEIESALISHKSVAEAAVVGKPHSIKGESICAYILLRKGMESTNELKDELKKHVKRVIGSIATPDEIFIVEKLPKTRSGKIMRRIIRSLIIGKELGDLTTLEDPSAVEEVRRWLSNID
jgi:acetyl-CoA synthetase